MNVSCGGGPRLEARCSPEEYLVAKGEAVTGKGFRFTEGEEMDEEVEVEERARSRSTREGIRLLSLSSRSEAGRSWD